MAAYSDEEKDVDVDSDDHDYDDLSEGVVSRLDVGHHNQAEKRAHHNALERRRRDHIKDSFSGLRDCVPALQGEKQGMSSRKTELNHRASRAQILNKATDYIQYMRRKNIGHQQDIEKLQQQNTSLETQVNQLERALASGNIETAELLINNLKSSNMLMFEFAENAEQSDTGDSSSSDNDNDDITAGEQYDEPRQKRMKLSDDSSTGSGGSLTTVASPSR